MFAVAPFVITAMCCATLAGQRSPSRCPLAGLGRRRAVLYSRVGMKAVRDGLPVSEYLRLRSLWRAAGIPELSQVDAVLYCCHSRICASRPLRFIVNRFRRPYRVPKAFPFRFSLCLNATYRSCRSLLGAWDRKWAAGSLDAMTRIGAALVCFLLRSPFSDGHDRHAFGTW